MRVVVGDACVFVALNKIGQMDVLHGLYTELMVPQEVASEILTKTQGKVDVRTIEWVAIKVVPGELLVGDLLTVHKGEAEAIALARQESAWLFLSDDKDARKLARRLGLDVTGTMGILVHAKRAGLVERVGPLVDELVSKGEWISETLRKDVLRAAGE